MVPLCVSMAFSCPELTHKGPSLSTHELRLHQILVPTRGSCGVRHPAARATVSGAGAHRQDLEEPRAPVWTQSGCRVVSGKAPDSDLGAGSLRTRGCGR